MFSGLLKEAELTIREAKASNSSLKQSLVGAKLAMGISDTLVDAENQYNPRLPSGPTTCFPKADRFKDKPKEPLTFTDTIDLSTSVSETDSMQGVKFPRQQRFREQKRKHETLLYPKLDLVKKSKPSATIKPLSEKQRSMMGKSTVSRSTQAESFVASLGPGTYTPSITSTSRNVQFPKGKRFAEIKPNEETPLFPKDSLTKKRPPSAAVLKPNTLPTANLISKKRQEQTLERLKMLYWQTVPLEYDRLFKSSVGPIIREDYFQVSKMTGVQRRCAMQMLIDRMNYLRGGFEYEPMKGQAPCAVVYRKSTPKPFKLPEHTPGPDEYHPRDDLIRPTAGGYTFAKQHERPHDEDARDYDINYEFFKKVQNVLINPEHQPKRLTEEELSNLNRGPGFYDAVFSQVERRADFGVIRLPELTATNDRVNNLYEKKQVNDGVYFPRYTAIDANVAAPLYKKPVDVEPMHLPDKILYPEHWEFYDGDLNKVRAELAKNVLIGGGMSFDEYKKYTRQMQVFKEYLIRQRRMPEVGEYDPSYKLQDQNIIVPNMEKMQERGLEPIVKEEGEVDGDNLILNPDKPRPNIPGFDMAKQVARQEVTDCSDEPLPGDVLILNPQLPQKKLPDLKFEKQIGRGIAQPQNDDGQDGNRLILNPTYPDKHIPEVKIDKYRPRDEPVLEMEVDQQPVLLIDPCFTQVVPRVKGFVDMQRHSQVRLVPILRKANNGQDQSPNNVHP